MDLGDQLNESLVVVCTVSAFALRTDPSAVVRAVGHQDAAQQLGAEPVAQSMDESEALPRRRAVDQWLRRFTQDLVFPTQALDLTRARAQLLAQFGDSSSEVMTACSAGHDRTLPHAANLERACY